MWNQLPSLKRAVCKYHSVCLKVTFQSSVKREYIEEKHTHLSLLVSRSILLHTFLVHTSTPGSCPVQLSLILWATPPEQGGVKCLAKGHPSGVSLPKSNFSSLSKDWPHNPLVKSSLLATFKPLSFSSRMCVVWICQPVSWNKGKTE